MTSRARWPYLREVSKSSQPDANYKYWISLDLHRSGQLVRFIDNENMPLGRLHHGANARFGVTFMLADEFIWSFFDGFI